ncbi:putative mitochondrial hypothetical protein [Leptomonas pyrrhocoris]|uniref:Uncharacterized protein n=1 Tax=Leptomonas pyrrhocoris TaxID=157538 RepID=A0A0M9G1T0_LEPPY|nr:putative mitochondrial hypothetical protein [Leptomonas pyrrhocoris]XP_015658866.1 putative mitochondrial hypothetical protein [Leptomonas pyrrhocoris]KPA80426.1 putative mitochondrial hypothetical protein [Leptomonas pyrrhocoris]KPA80427.1 putative mitochondrial hypothetical protein [Leptomonas pyrrhocoris]|eukprot:XP_015658865.1 putative mitochondrial hypothetical protein [Leptomonas pyrrhocoris]
MFRSVKISRAPLAALKPVLADSVETQNTIRRMIGVKTVHAINVNAINSVVEKLKGEGLAGTTATVARASAYLLSRNPTDALVEVETVLPKIQDKALRRLAIGIRLRSHNDLLDIKEASLNVSGGATEAEVSDIRSKLQDDYKELVASSPGCWLVELAAAEYSLYTGANEEAYNHFVAVEKKIQDYIKAPIQVSQEVATPENTNEFSLIAFQIRRARPGVKPQDVSATVAEGMTNVMADPNATKALEAAKKALGGQLSNEEAIELALTLQEANVRHHFHDFFPTNADHYDEWTSEGAVKAKQLISEAVTPHNTGLKHEAIEKIRTSVPHKPFYDSEEKLRAFLKSAPKDRSIIASIRETFGPGPITAVSSSDQAVADAVESVDLAVVSSDTAAGTDYACRGKEIAKALAKQMLYRTQVQKAVALTEMNRLQDAVEAVTPVINASEYIYMWRALLARSRAYKGLGLITNSDKDLKELNRLKHSLTERTPYEKK